MRRLKFLRQNANMTMADLERRSGVSRSYICKAEKWGNHLGEGQLVNLADALGWRHEPSALMDEVEDVKAVS